MPARAGLTPARARGGRHRAVASIPADHGLTPARAGTATARTWTWVCKWAHPRAGGDGTRGRWPGRRSMAGLTPARAGTATGRPGRGCAGLTPARAGTAAGLTGPGSPPRGRGRCKIPACVAGHLIGLTPARAGTAREPHFRVPCRGSPPRGRGRSRVGVVQGDGGAHPRAGGDGLRPAAVLVEVEYGLTPARAGTAGRSRAPPRMRGSPPRGRGRRRPRTRSD